MNKKGFTLIELLAVIVILAVIAIIAVPTILGVVEKAKKGAAQASALNYIDAIEKYMILSEIDNEKYPIKLEAGKKYYLVEDSVYLEDDEAFNFNLIDSVKAEETVSNIYLTDLIKVKGTVPVDGFVVLGDKNNVVSSTLAVSGYETECTGNSCEITGTYQDVVVNSLSITNKSKTNLKINEQLQLNKVVDPTDTKVKWTSSNTEIATVDQNGLVTGIKPGNVRITVEAKKKKDSLDLTVEYVSYKIADQVTVGGVLWRVVENSDGLNPNVKLLKATNTDSNKYPFNSTNVSAYATSTMKVLVDKYVNGLKLGTSLKEARLITVPELVELGCVIGGSCRTATWLTDGTIGFWTGTSMNSSQGYYIRRDRVLAAYYVSSSSDTGLRPLIIVSKDIVK